MINDSLAKREFSDATQTAYQYCYNSLCDVYIENSKSIIQDGTPEESESAQQTLYTALEGCLKLLHPFMPFLTEELWQRLPRRPNDTCPTIVKATYPQYQESLDDPASEAAYELVLALSRCIRSLAGSYDIKDDAQIFIGPQTDDARKTCEAQLPSIKQLGGKVTFGPSAKISILSPEDPNPDGCVAQAIGTTAAVFLLVKGRVDIDKQIEKAQQRREKSNEVIKKQQKLMHSNGWNKMKGEAQESERQKLGDAESEVALLDGSIEQFQRLKLE